MIDVQVMIVSDRRGPGDWFGWKLLNLPAVPRVDESISTNSGWTYRVTTVNYDQDGMVSIIITTDPKGK